MMTMPLLIFFLALTLVRSIRGHWPAPAYVAGLILGAASVVRGGAWGRRLHNGTIAGLVLAGLALPVVLHSLPAAHLSGWTQLAAEVRKLSPASRFLRQTAHIVTGL